MTTAALLERLQKHYLTPGQPMPGGVFAGEVGINGGGRRRVDALYAGFTSSSGRILIGHEIKVSRADWQHELDQADKADMWADACHSWYVVAPSTAIVDPSTVPAGWGLMIPNPRSKNRFELVVKAPVKEEFDPPWWAVRSLMARLDTLDRTDINARVNEARTKGYEEAIRQATVVQQRSGEIPYEYQNALRVVRAFEDAGIKLAEHPFGDVLGPAQILPVLSLLIQGAKADQVLNHMRARFGPIPKLQRQVAELAEAVNGLGEL